jgi:hypothetical protein
MRWVSVLLVTLLAGCPGPAPSSDAGADTPPQSASLHVTWNPRPAAIPGAATSEITITDAEFGVESLRVVGDAGPGDPRTFVQNLDLNWDSDDKPAPLVFANAPPGLYSRMEWLLATSNQLRADTVYAFEIEGEVEIDDNTEKFRIRESAQLPIAFEVQADLTPPSDATVAVRVDVIKIVTAVNYRALPRVDGELLLAPGDAQMPTVRQKVVEAFSKEDSPSL